MAEFEEFYNYEKDLKDKTPEAVADMIRRWRNSEDEFADAAFDLLNAIEDYLRNDVEGK